MAAKVSIKISGNRKIFVGGIYTGLEIEAAPVRYMFHLFRESSDQSVRLLARKELITRGALIGGVDLTAHAIDQASVRLLKRYEDTHKKNEGLYSWLSRISTAALERGTRFQDDTIGYKGMVFVFCFKNSIPLLKTIIAMRTKEKEAREL